MDDQDYQHSPLSPPPLRLPSKTGPGTTRIGGESLSTATEEMEFAIPASKTTSHLDSQHWSAIRERLRTAPKLAGLVSKFEILDAMSVLGGKSLPPPIPLRNPSRLGTTTSSLGPYQLKQAQSVVNINMGGEPAQKVAWRTTIEEPCMGSTQVQGLSGQAATLSHAQDDISTRKLFRHRSTSTLRSTANDSGAGVSATD